MNSPATSRLLPPAPRRRTRSTAARAAARDQRPRDPLPLLLTSTDHALRWRTRRDLLDEAVDEEELWRLPEVVRIVRRRLPSGGFAYPSAGARPAGTTDYEQYQTYKTLLTLTARYSLTRRHPAVAEAAEYLFDRQTRDGDFRGIYGAQYCPTYGAQILSVLSEAGYAQDSRVHRGHRWFLRMRQHDGGWAIPLRTHAEGRNFAAVLARRAALEPDRTRPSSHLVTGMVVRAFAMNPRWCHDPAVTQAAVWLSERFFTADAYTDRRTPAFWKRLTYPFTWTDALSVLDALTRLGIGRENAGVEKARSWLMAQQREDGTWACGYAHSPDSHADLWVTYAAATVLRRL
ncbi:MAG TPA: prenyltransferase/squalene oxidase repeat-containing protein [Polyangia bacterium]